MTPPPRTLALALDIPNLYGRGMTPQMTYYESPRGAKVFAAGAFGLARAASDPRVGKLFANLWSHLDGRLAAAAILGDAPH